MSRTGCRTEPGTTETNNNGLGVWLGVFYHHKNRGGPLFLWVRNALILLFGFAERITGRLILNLECSQTEVLGVNY